MNLDGFLPKAILNRCGVIGIGVVCCNIGKDSPSLNPSPEFHCHRDFPPGV